MRTVESLSNAYPGGYRSARAKPVWKQAGLSSLAYRLAHFSLPRPAIMAGIGLAFYLF